jgi:hypothetical protein
VAEIGIEIPTACLPLALIGMGIAMAYRANLSQFDQYVFAISAVVGGIFSFQAWAKHTPLFKREQLENPEWFMPSPYFSGQMLHPSSIQGHDFHQAAPWLNATGGADTFSSTEISFPHQS